MQLSYVEWGQRTASHRWVRCKVQGCTFTLSSLNYWHLSSGRTYTSICRHHSQQLRVLVRVSYKLVRGGGRREGEWIVLLLLAQVWRWRTIWHDITGNSSSRGEPTMKGSTQLRWVSYGVCVLERSCNSSWRGPGRRVAPTFLQQQ